ncbi:ATP-binding protein [Eubacteriales bacterium OttesenSCG-928-K08]|nr:ATP-binding protein [Eubacteriales bacterium OttesenSCG-928-K08]
MKITSGRLNSAQKVVLYGPEGIGKSTFASKFPAPIFIDVEGGTKKLDVQRTARPTSWTMLLDQVQFFKTTSHEYQTLIIDTADWAEQLCVAHVCAKAGKKGIEDFGYGKGYTYLAEEFGRLLNQLEELIESGMHVVLTAHAKIHSFDQPDEMGSYNRWALKLGKQTTPLVKEWADMVLFANYKTYVVNVDGQGADKGKNKVQGGKRVIYTSHHPCWDAKNRDDLPEEIDLDYNAIAHCIPSMQNVAPTSPPVAYPPPTPIDELNIAPVAPPTPAQSVTPEVTRTPDPQPSSIPRALLDLMQEHGVLETEIQMAVSGKGYYPMDTPIEKYDPAFIDGVLVGAWPQVQGMIAELRQTTIPF